MGKLMFLAAGVLLMGLALTAYARSSRRRHHHGVKGGVKLYHLVCSCSAKRSELTGQHKCPHHLLREMACLRVGQQRTGRKVLMLPILREACLEFGRQLPLCYA